MCYLVANDGEFYHSRLQKTLAEKYCLQRA